MKKMQAEKKNMQVDMKKDLKKNSTTSNQKKVSRVSKSFSGKSKVRVIEGHPEESVEHSDEPEKEQQCE